MNKLPPRFGRHSGPQSSMPSQDESVAVSGKPFSPVNQPDVRNPFKTKIGNLPVSGDPDTDTPPAPLEMSDVRHVFDSRPPRAFDWYFQDMFQNITPGTIPTSRLGGFTVPNGSVLLVRYISLTLQFNRSLFGVTLGNVFGGLHDAIALSELPQLALVVDDVPTPFFTPTPPAPAGPALRGIPLFDALLGDVNFECFVPVGPGSLFSIRPFINYPSVNGTQYDIIVRYHGNLLLETGRSLVNEVGNQYPLPVTINEMG